MALETLTPTVTQQERIEQQAIHQREANIKRKTTSQELFHSIHCSRNSSRKSESGGVVKKQIITSTEEVTVSSTQKEQKACTVRQ